MASPRPTDPARSGRSLLATVVLPVALLAVVIGVGIALLVSAGGQRAAHKELDARAATVKRSWDAAGRPTHGAELKAVGARMSAKLRVVRGRHPAEPTTSGDARTYSYPTRDRTTLKVALSTKASSDAITSSRVAGLVIALLGGILLAALLPGLLRGSSSGRVRKLESQLGAERERVTELERRVGTDQLTGLPTGPRVRQAIEVEIKRAEREMAPMAVVILDFDKFKSVNEAHGRQAGDRILLTAVERFMPSLRATDIFARVLGDEFAIILPKANAAHAEMVITRGREALADVKLEGFTLTFSAGYAVFPSDGRDADTLLQAAEGALQMAQREWDATRRFDPAEITVKHSDGEWQEVVDVMKVADGITPVFQPLVTLATGQVSGYEALTRFKQPPKRFPDQWFNLASRVGLGAALEASAIQRALAVPNRPAGTYLSLNLSPSTLRAPEVNEVLPEDLTGLVIEITEHELASDDEVLANDLAALRARGARIAVDDAGAGYAGLQQLMRVAPDLIKLDRSLVQNINDDPAKQALVDSFVRFGRRTGAQVVAEGIETEDELRVLADLDVAYGQGYFLAKPGPPWAGVSPWISEKLMRRSLGGQISVEDISKLPYGSDQRLAAVAARIAQATTLDDVSGLTPVICEELGADELVLFTRGYDGALAATSPRPWMPNGGRLDLAHFPAFEEALRTGDPEQILADRGSGTTTSAGEVALLANAGFGSLLVIPVGPHAMLHAYLTDPRPWSRAQTNRALVLAYQLAPVLATTAAHAPAV